MKKMTPKSFFLILDLIRQKLKINFKKWDLKHQIMLFKSKIYIFFIQNMSPYIFLKNLKATIKTMKIWKKC